MGDVAEKLVLSSLPNDKLLELLKEINVIPLKFRNKLNLSENISFGNEIEVNSLPLDTAVLVTELFNDVHELEDKDRYVVHQEETADAEVVTPILTNSANNWSTFYDMYDMLYDTGATIGHNTSSHIHIGTHAINTPEKLSLLLKTLVVFEPIIFKFGYGVGDKPRNFLQYRSSDYCVFSVMSSPKRYRAFIEELEHFNYKSQGVMYGHFREFLRQDLLFRPGFNFNNFDFSKLQYGIALDSPNKDDHFEIRCFNGTLNPAVAQNNINLITHIVQAVIDGKIDKKYVESEYVKYKKKRLIEFFN